MQSRWPERIVCLTEETTEALYLMNEQQRIVGISGYTVRPAIARKEKPKVSAYTSAKLNKILDLKPDLILAFSDMQADIVADLIRAGQQVHTFNQRSVDGILTMINTLGALIGRTDKSDQLIDSLNQHIESVKQSAAHLPNQPKIFFEEWYDPLISGIGWVSELIEIAGGKDCFPELAKEPGAKQRIIADPSKVIERQPDIIIGSWCGRKFRPEQVKERADWLSIPAVKENHIYEVKSADILQPGPAALTDGLTQLHDIIKLWCANHNALNDG
ncbi:MAG: cobalamin-binding protein [Pseudomonadales bacterium]|nr:cobalamin-binding protein [Pseudomonadales bacterium]